eukprot:TRINITY_DN5388_c0_g1_i1.p1 TRINITY_DN5388_c0_g1~~TRINITY_DN5388_c0_g1_i1.p1  ORF type:complete len:637 (+),score=148.49 TRINITY_DN5388_c0_g1_i1:135-1913(+)
MSFASFGNPFWNETVYIDRDDTSLLSIVLYDYKPSGPKKVGVISLDMLNISTELNGQNQAFEKWFNFEDNSGSQLYVRFNSLQKEEKFEENVEVPVLKSKKSKKRIKSVKHSIRLGRDSGVPNMHFFIRASFSQPTFCAICETYVWGLSKEGYFCRNCKLNCHRKCLRVAKNQHPCDPEITNSLNASSVPSQTSHLAHTTFTIYLSNGTRTSNILKPEVKLETVLKKICMTRDLAYGDHVAEDKNGRHLDPNILMGDIPDRVITFMKIESSQTEEEEDKQNKLTLTAARKKRGKFTSSRLEEFIESQSGKKYIKGKLEYKDYRIGDEIGTGANSVVHLAEHLETGEIVAIKIVDRDNGDKDIEKNMKKEIDVMCSLRNDGIISCYGYGETEKKYFIVMELVSGGELFDDLVYHGYYSEQKAATVIIQLLNALKYLHDKGYVHRDIKPENLVYTNETKNEIKLIDFGEAIECDINNKLTTFCGTPDYMAPEIIKGLPYSYEVDLWASGVITYVLLAGYPTFEGNDEFEIFSNIMAVNYYFPIEDWQYISDEAKDFINSLLKSEPSQRLTATEAINHNWIKSNAWQPEPEYEDY